MSEIQAGTSKGMLWTGRVMSGLAFAAVLFASVVKLLKTAGMVEGFARAGIPEKLVVPVGVIELVCVVLYAIPRTAVLGAIFMTGLLGAATFVGLRIGDPSYPVPFVLGMMAWGGLFLRDARVRKLIPFRSKPE